MIFKSFNLSQIMTKSRKKREFAILPNQEVNWHVELEAYFDHSSFKLYNEFSIRYLRKMNFVPQNPAFPIIA